MFIPSNKKELPQSTGLRILFDTVILLKIFQFDISDIHMIATHQTKMVKKTIFLMPIIMIKKTLTISNERGLHTRAAIQIVEIAKKAKYGVWVSKENQRADASSALELMTLYCPKGSEVTIEIDHAYDNDIMNKIALTIEERFGEK
jgi:phosphotransferase system HPr (HPr) family protein